MGETEYKLAHEGPEIDAAIGRALPGGEIDLSLSNKADKTPPTEYDLPMANGWTHINADDPLKYGNCGDGRVQIMGAAIAPSNVAPGQQIATLPLGSLPIGRKAWIHAVDANTGLDYSLIVYLDGAINLWSKAPPAGVVLVFPVQSFYGA